MTTIIDNWINRSEIEMDYYTLFIKAWIPFNAWYMINFYDETQNRNTDKNIIDYLKNNSNKYRDKIKSLLTGPTEEAKFFRENISNLHYELEGHPIPNHANKISFLNLSLSKNPRKNHTHNYKAYTYKVEFKDQLPRTQARFFCEVLRKRSNTTIYRVELFAWSIQELSDHPDFIAINNHEIQTNLRDCFQEINPNKPVDIIIQPTRFGNEFRQPRNTIVINDNRNLYFTNDIDKVSKVIIQLIYELRCKLFHGELDPTESNQGAYKYAYNIQKILIRELR